MTLNAFLFVVQITLITFKLDGLIAASWWWVFSPFFIANALSFAVAFKREFIKSYNTKKGQNE